MKNAIYYFCLLCAMTIGAAGCSKDPAIVEVEKETEKEVTKPLIAIEVAEIKSIDQVDIMFTPESGVAAGFIHAIGTEEDREAFRNGTFENSKIRSGDSPITLTFNGLEQGRTYTVFARAHCENGKYGPVASATFTMQQASELAAEIQVVTYNSAVIKFQFPHMGYHRLDYVIGKPSDRGAFIDGTMQGIGSVSERPHYSVSRFDLEPSTEYCAFMKVYDRVGEWTLVETPFTTKAKADCPDAAMEIVNQDAYRDVYKFIPNENCEGKLSVLFVPEGQYEDGWERYGGVLSSLDGWTQSKYMVVQNFMPGEPVTINITSTDFPLDKKYTVHVLIYEKQTDALVWPKPVALYRMSVTDNGKIEGAGTAEVQIQVSDITKNGATFTYTHNEHTMGYLFDTVDADWYDAFKQTSQWSEFYLHERFISENVFWQYTKDPLVQFTETKAVAGKRYYAAACPMNVNGPNGDGWGPEVLVEFTTLTE